MPATPGKSLQCCSQHTESERSGWDDKVDMKRDWCTTLGGRARRQKQKMWPGTRDSLQLCHRARRLGWYSRQDQGPS